VPERTRTAVRRLARRARRWQDSAVGRRGTGGGGDLDRLLERQEFDAFETPAGVARPPLPSDRCELLACSTERGYLTAAEEWLAVAAAAPDGHALAGLARVAYARGQADDALVLLDEALRLDPTIDDARALREVLATAA
jgi:tetratricopeptide (TPR) repeat protein